MKKYIYAFILLFLIASPRLALVQESTEKTTVEASVEITTEHNSALTEVSNGMQMVLGQELLMAKIRAGMPGMTAAQNAYFNTLQTEYIDKNFIELTQKYFELLRQKYQSGDTGTRGDPLFIAFPGYPINHTLYEAASYKHWKPWLFDYKSNGELLWMERSYTGLMLFIDLDGNGIPSNGDEILASPKLNSYEMLSLVLDVNKDGKFDSKDPLWPKAKWAQWIDGSTWEIFSMQVTKVVSLDLRPIIVEPDCAGKGYGNYNRGWDAYTHDEAFFKCIDETGSGWINYISEDNMRHVAYHPHGATLEDGSTARTHAAVLGWIPKE